MKHIFLLALCFSVLYGYGQNVGIATTLPTERLHVDTGNIKIGAGVWTSATDDRFLKFGDGNYVRIGEASGDDIMQLYARKFLFFNSNPGFGGNFMEIEGKLRIADGTEGNGKVLMSAVDGSASWQPLPAGSASFRAVKGSVQGLSSGTLNLVSFGSTQYNLGGAYASDVFTAPVGGIYHFDVKVLWNLTAVGSRYFTTISLKSGFITEYGVLSQQTVDAGFTGTVTTEISADIQLSAGQTVNVIASQNSGITQNVGATYSYFSAHRVN